MESHVFIHRIVSAIIQQLRKRLHTIASAYSDSTLLLYFGIVHDNKRERGKARRRLLLLQLGVHYYRLACHHRCCCSLAHAVTQTCNWHAYGASFAARSWFSQPGAIPDPARPIYDIVSLSPAHAIHQVLKKIVFDRYDREWTFCFLFPIFQFVFHPLIPIQWNVTAGLCSAPIGVSVSTIGNGEGLSDKDAVCTHNGGIYIYYIGEDVY